MKDKVEQIKKKNMIISRIFSNKLQQIIEKYNHRHEDKGVYEILEALVNFKYELFKTIESIEAKDLTKTVKENNRIFK